MKKNIFLILLVSFSAASVYAQEPNIPPDKSEQFEAMRVAFITKRLALSADEAKVFWPVYDEYRKELQAVYRKRQRVQRRAQAEFEYLSDAELEELSDKYIGFQKEEYEVRARYHEELKKVLSARQVLLLYKAEADLNREILKRIQQRRQRMGN